MKSETISMMQQIWQRQKLGFRNVDASLRLNQIEYIQTFQLAYR